MSVVNSQKRQRGENWLEEDKMILKDLVKERVQILENKNTDSNTNCVKTAAWNDLRESFNVMCNGPERSVSQLKAQWGLLKLKAKRARTTENRDITMTGDGPPNIKQASDDIGSWLPDFLNDTNSLDSDQERKIVSLNNIKIEIDHDNHNNIPEIRMEEPTVEVPPLLPAMIPQDRLTPQVPNFCNASKMVSHKTGHSPTELAATYEMECRRQLHAIQMENEKRKRKNLQLEQILLKQKILYYRSKNKKD